MVVPSQRVALVTGSSRGLGRAISEHLVDKDFKVIGVSRNSVESWHPSYSHYDLDLLDSNAISHLFKDLRKKSITVDTLINNAGVLTSQYALILDPNLAKEMVLTNLWAPFVVSREAARAMRKIGWGRIVNIGSMAPALEVPGDSIYAACKKGLETYSNILAIELAEFGITSNLLGISAFDTDMLAQLPTESLDEALKRLPIPNKAKFSDISNVIDFFVSENSSNITAQTVYLGGAH
jgi:3-oxoacyl-[acyl-carrier protein] reductase